MLKTISHFHEQFMTMYGQIQPVKLPFRRIDRVIVAGMGGSALPADLVNDYLGFQTLTIIRDYQLPSGLTEHDLVLCSSFSGNTEETLGAFEEALARKLPVMAVAHGGELLKRAGLHEVPFVNIPSCIQPRCATGYFFAALLGILEKIKKIPSQQATLEKLAAFLQSHQNGCATVGKELAEFFKEKVPVIYGPTSLAGVCRIFKIKINENAKVPAFWNVFPELNHNEMVGFTQLKMNPAIVCLKSRFMNPRIARRMQVMQEVLASVAFKTVDLAGADLLEEMFYAYLLADYSSYYLAGLYGVDPTPVAMVEEFKKKL